MDAEKLKVIKKSLAEYCSYRERTPEEVKSYIKKYALPPILEDSLILELIEKDYLNEYRFARHYASGKFRINGWGKEKISYHLRQKRISDGIIQIALSEIDEEEYQMVLANHIRQKKKEIRYKHGDLVAKNKIYRYLMSKGFEYELVKKALDGEDEI